jgi:serine/threonine-protein kinase
MNCAFCHTPLPESSRFCMTCGADLSDPEVSTRTRTAVKELFDAIKVAVEGRYNVTDMLGRGGMGAVFLAEDLRLGRTVALKVLRPELALEGTSVGRFEREARIAARLDHPNIIPIYAVEEVGGLHYFVMKYIAGKSLDELLTAEPLPIELCRQVIWQAACGLGHAHQRGVVHRDVKPSNIMIDESGRSIITDFGISKAFLQETQYTSTGQMIGTPRYVSPEQAQGLPLDGRSDQYSLAVVGYQMMVGRLPLVADSVHALMYKHIYEVPTSARSMRQEVPDAMSDAIQRALAKDPDDRFPTIEDFATALWPERPVQAGQPPPTIPSFSPLVALVKAQRRRRRPLAILGVLVAAVVVAFLLGRRTEAPTQTGNDVGVAPAPAPSAPVAPSQPVTVPQPTETVRTVAPAPDTGPSAIFLADTVRDSAPKRRPVTKPRPAAKREAPQPAPPRPSATPPPPAAAAANGFVTINAIPYGTVSIDGVEVGDTPIVRRALPPGPHTIRIVRPGFRAETVPVNVTPGNELRVSRSLIKDSL